MDALNLRQTDLFLARQRVNRWWFGPFLLAVGIHVLTAVLSVSLPEFMTKKPLLDEVVTVNLVSLPDSGPPQPKSAPAQKKAAAPPVQKKVKAPPVTKPEVPIPEPVKKEAVAVEPAKPISITPQKRKVQKSDDTRLADEKEKELQRKLEARRVAEEQRDLERQQRLAQARLDELRAEEKARNAREALAALLRKNEPTGAGGGSTGSQQVSMVLQQYLSAIDGRIRAFWVLPEMKKWDSALETVAILTIRRDGTVVKQEIERKSSDPFYDQFVLKTIESALPMPPFPALMKQESIEVGIRFRPGELLF